MRKKKRKNYNIRHVFIANDLRKTVFVRRRYRNKIYRRTETERNKIT